MQTIDSFKNRLAKALSINNMKPVELHEKTGLSESLISKYLSGIAVPRQRKIDILSEALDVDPVWLMGYNVPLKKISFNNKQVFPLLGTVKAGYNYLAGENIIGYVYLDKEVSNPEEYFALKVTGDSMQPVLYDDDIVIVHSQNDIESGQIGIILIDGDEATIKRIIKHDDCIELIAFNSYYPPKKLNKDFKIIGKVVEARISKIFE